MKQIGAIIVVAIAMSLCAACDHGYHRFLDDMQNQQMTSLVKLVNDLSAENFRLRRLPSCSLATE